MKVNRNNYEVWMIDYFDGKLNADETIDLMAFIDQHPDLKEEFEMFDPTGLQADKISFDEKRSLRRKPIKKIGTVHEENYEELFTAFYDNDLNEIQKEEVIGFVKENPQLEHEFKLHARLLIQTDQTIIYPKKEELKKRPVIGVYWWAASAAAAMLLLFGVISLLQLNPETIERSILAVNKIESKSPEIIVANSPSYSLPETQVMDIAIAKIVYDDELIDREIFASIPANNYYPELIDLNNYAFQKEFHFHESEMLIADVSKNDVEKEKNGLLAKVIKNYSKRAALRQETKKEKRDKKDPGFVRFLDQSITVFNTVTGSDAEMIKSYDKDGNLTYYQVEGETISWSKEYASNQHSE